MTKKLIRIGNSQGVILDKSMLSHLGVTEEVNIALVRNKIILTPAKRPKANRTKT